MKWSARKAGDCINQGNIVGLPGITKDPHETTVMNLKGDLLMAQSCAEAESMES